MQQRLRYLILIVSGFMVLSSCVGEIESTKKPLNSSVETPPPSLDYDGFFEAKTISNSKVEVYFYPFDGENKDTTYEISYDGLEVPISVPGEVLKKDYRGLYRYVVIGLDIKATYVFSVQVRDVIEQKRSYNKTRIEATTYGNLTADFDGVSRVEALPGIAGVNGLKVFWPEARKEGSLISPKEFDPTAYQIIILNGEKYTPADFDNTQISTGFRKVFMIGSEYTNFTVNGLQEDTKYYIRVRATHHGYTLYGNDPTYEKETNNKYIEHQTFSSDGSNIEFSADSFEVEVPSNSTGLSSVDTSWNPANGVFDHYRIYYTNNMAMNLAGYTTVDAACNGQETNNSDVYCKKVDFLASSAQVTNLQAHTDYQFILAVCAHLECIPSKRVSSITVQKKTSPPYAPFDGIISISHPKFANKLDEVYLNIIPPDTSAGVIDGLIVEYIDESDTSHFLNNPEVPNSSSLQVSAFDHNTATELTIKGVDAVDASKEFCFKVIPYIINASGNVEMTSSPNERCISPQVITPDATEFPGVDSCVNKGSSFLTFDWSTPDAGIYSHYQIFIKEGPAGFSFSDAISGDPDYQSFITSDANTSFTVTALNNNTDHQIGVVTYFNYNGTIMRSEYADYITCRTDP